MNNYSLFYIFMSKCSYSNPTKDILPLANEV